MENVYIDTSIFEGNNFLEGKRINELLKLGEEGHIQIILPMITLREIQSRAINHIKNSVSRFRRYRDETKIFRNIDSLEHRFEPINEEECIDEFLALFEKRLTKSKVLIVDYPTINIKEVFDKYFNNKFPFSKGEKKHEFPDAFSLLSVETWCKETKAKCFVFSNDKDLLNYESEVLKIIPAYGEYLDEKLRKIEAEKKRQERLERADKLYSENKGRLEDEIESWLTTELDDFETYYRYTGEEVHNISIKDTSVTLMDYQLISINEHQILLEAQATIYYNVEIEIDDPDSGYYDSEDKVRIYTDTETQVFEREQIIPIQLKISIPVVDVDILDIEIEEYNDGKELKLR